MGVFSRIAKLFESNVNALLDRAEDPAKVLDQAIDDMKKGREETRKAVVDAKTELKLAQKRRDKAIAEARAYESKAMSALESGNEQVARALLEKKIEAEERAGNEDTLIESHGAQVKELVATDKAIERQLKELPAKRSALLARQAAANARGAGAPGKAKSSVHEALQAFDRVEEKVVRAEVEAEVNTDMQPPNLLLIAAPSATEERTDQLLLELKSKIRGQLTAGAPVKAAPPVADNRAGRVDDSLALLKAKLDKK
ncbi:MAG: PspA/IM30 family protein [Deltaproteobacteria bacterium]|nr:PspA/IM30 family protein [Deltaproteobacteria bacterium]